MAAYKILGNVYKIGATEPLQSKNGTTFTRRTLTLCQNRFNPDTGEAYPPNYIELEFSGNNCPMLDQFRQNDRVQVTFDVGGSMYKDKNTGEERNITRLRAFKIERYVQQQAQQAPQQAYHPQQASNYNSRPQQTQYAPQGYAPQQNFPPTPTDDLPY